MNYNIAFALMIGITIGIVITPDNNDHAAKKASDVDYVIGQCQKLHPKKTCVLVAMPEDTE